MLFCQWFDSDKERVFAAAVAIVMSSVWGIGFGMNYADLSTISQVHGTPPAVLAQLVGLALAAYATFYGWALFVAGWLSSLVAALWIKEKASEVQKLLS
jgi:hypothetical protein